MAAVPGKINCRFLGKSGLKVSDICLGAMTFGNRPNFSEQLNEEQAHQILDRYVEWGGNFIDTSNNYGRGASETILGNWLCKQERHKLVIATKVRDVMSDDDPNGVGLSRHHIMHQVDESLRRLQTDYIDLYQIHKWDDGVPLEETLSAFNDLVRLGKVRYLGASNVLGWQLQKIVDMCQQRGWAPFVALQNQYSLLERGTELDLVDVCRNEGIGLLPWSPLKGGYLSGKIRRDTVKAALDPESRVGWASGGTGRESLPAPTYDSYANEKTWKLLDLMDNIKGKYEKSIPQVALRWLLEKDVVSSVVIGVKTVKQLDDNLGASCGWSLTPEEVSQLDDASAYDLPYPHNMVHKVNINRQRNK